MLRHATRLLHGLLAVGLLLGLAPSARAAATYDVTQVGDVGFSQVWNATGNKEVKSGDTIGFNPWSVHITLEGHIDDISALAAGDVVSVPLTSDAGSHFSMNGTGWECADDVATSDGTVAFKANMRDGRADLRLTRTAARLSGRFDFRVVIRNGNLWYADRKSTSSTWHAGSDTFAFHNTTKPNHRCVNDTTGVGVNSTKSGVGASMVTWNCATVNRIARGGAESDTAPDVTYHIHVASADEGHPVTVASGTRAFEAYHAYDGTTAGDAFTGPGGGSHVAYTPKRTDGTPTAGEYRLVANADGSYDYDLDIGPREGRERQPVHETGRRCDHRRAHGSVQHAFPGGLRRNQHQFRLVDGETLRGRDLDLQRTRGRLVPGVQHHHDEHGAKPRPHRL